MTPELLLAKFGYLAVFVGTFLEGETILALAGFFAERKLLSLQLVIVVGFAGANIGHAFWFWVGRRHATRIIERFPHFDRRFARVTRLFDRYGIAAIFITQYIYGLRLASAVVFGMTNIPARTFFAWQAVSCLIWASLIAGLGYTFGRAVERVIGQAADVEKWGLAILIGIAICLGLYHRFRERASPAE